MGRSSRILAFLCIAGLCSTGVTLACAQGRVGAGRGIGLLAPSVGVNPGINPGIHRGIMPGVHPNVPPGVRPNVFPNVRTGVNPNVRPGVYDRGIGLGEGRGRFGDGRGRFGEGRGRGYGGGDLDAAGLGLGLGSDFPALPYGDGGYGGGYPPQFVPADVPTCPHPLIISIGRGLRHPAHTRVVYGARPACAP